MLFIFIDISDSIDLSAQNFWHPLYRGVLIIYSAWFFTISAARTQETTQWRSHKRPERNKNNTTKLNKESLWWAKPLIKIKIAWRFFFCALRKCSLRISNSPKGHKKGVKSTWANLCTFLSELFPYVFSRKKFFLEVKTTDRSCPFFENLGKYGTGQSRGKTCMCVLLPFLLKVLYVKSDGCKVFMCFSYFHLEEKRRGRRKF